MEYEYFINPSTLRDCSHFMVFQ